MRTALRPEGARRFKKDGMKLLLLALPFVALVIAFYYVPLFGWTYAFVNYKPGFAFSRMPWNNFSSFLKLISDREIGGVMVNTLAMAFLNLLISPLQVVLALLLNEVRNRHFKRVFQTVSTLPNFIGWVIIFSLSFGMFSSEGMLNQLLRMLNITDKPVNVLGNGSTLRLISDIKGVRYTEGRLLPYFFPDTFHEGGDPVGEAKANWVTARRALLRKPVDRIGYGGYLKLACNFPDFLSYVEQVADEFRMLYDNVHGMEPYCHKRVAVLNCFGKMRAWGCHMVHHALYQKQNYSYAGVIEALSGAPFDVSFVSFDDLIEKDDLLDAIDVVIMVGDADTAHTGGTYWENPLVSQNLRRYVSRGGGIIGVGEPTAHQYQSRFFQLADVLGVEKETGFTLGYDKYNWAEQEHFITAEDGLQLSFGEGKKGIYALEGTKVLYQRDKEVQLAANDYFKGRSVYMSGLPYTPDNNRLLHRAVLWCAHQEDALTHWFSSNIHTEVHAYVKNRKYCVVNNTGMVQQTVVYTTDGNSFPLELESNEIRWFGI